ncbi:MAG: heavy-metal-associated domain-containing protein [Terriglobia bacterium]
MSRPMFALSAAILFLVFTLAAPMAQAQILQAELKVKGLACPFCAYGLERKLKQLPGAVAFKLLLNENRARVQFSGERSPGLGDIPKVVDEAGFKLGALRLTLRAQRAACEGHPCLKLRDGQWVLLAGEGAGPALVEEVAEGEMVEVTGTVLLKQAQGHGQHPFTLRVESYQLVQRQRLRGGSN